jgi:hypothetical protein
MKATTATISAPYLGWNTRDPLDQMKEGYAVKLVNVYPDQGYVRTRKGYRLHCNTGESADVQTLIEFPLQNGNTQLIAGVNGKLINVTGSTPTTLATGLTNNQWQHAIFNNVVVLVNGADAPRNYNGTTVSAPTYQSHPSYPGLVSSNLIDVTVYKNRLYFVEKNTLSFWYGDLRATTGDLKEFDLQTVTQRGGTLAFLAPFSRDTGVGLRDYLVAVTSEGEVLVYEGTDPDTATDWGLAARFFLPAPVAGRRAYYNLGSDLLIVHKAGITALGTLLTAGNTAKYAAVTDVINKSFLDAATTWGDTSGWCLMYHPIAQSLYVNIPVYNAAEQFVMNPTIGAWTRYVGMHAFHWATMDDRLFFASAGGKIYEAHWGTDDNGGYIRSEIKTAYTYFGNRASTKRFTLARPTVKTPTGLKFSMAVDCDFQEGVFGTVQIGEPSTSLWNTSIWNVSLWDYPQISSEDSYSLTSIGRCASLSLAVETKVGSVELFAASITFEIGGIF